MIQIYIHFATPNCGYHLGTHIIKFQSLIISFNLSLNYEISS